MEKDKIPDSVWLLGKLQWGHDDEVVEKWDELGDDIAAELLQWGHDDEVVEKPTTRTPTRKRPSCFNGATTMRSWKSGLTPDDMKYFGKLQWGHDDEVVEKIETLILGLPRFIELQWGHDDEVVEKGTMAKNGAELWSCFNGATTMRSWKRRKGGAGQGDGRASMGPRR